MKTAVTAARTDKNAAFDSRFGRCGAFHIYDDNGFVKAIDNTAAASAHGAGVAAANIVVEEGVDSVITGNAGPNAFRVLQSANIKICRSTASAIPEAVEKMKKGELEEIGSPGAAGAGMGGGRFGGRR